MLRPFPKGITMTGLGQAQASPGRGLPHRGTLVRRVRRFTTREITSKQNQYALDDASPVGTRVRLLLNMLT